MRKKGKHFENQKDMFRNYKNQNIFFCLQNNKNRRYHKEKTFILIFYKEQTY